MEGRRYRYRTRIGESEKERGLGPEYEYTYECIAGIDLSLNELHGDVCMYVCMFIIHTCTGSLVWMYVARPLVCQYVQCTHVIWFSFRFLCLLLLLLLLLVVHEYKCCLSLPPPLQPPAPPLRICVCVSVLLLYVNECVSLLLCVLVCLLLVVIVALAVALLAWTFCFGSALSRLLINAVRRVFSLYLYVHKQIYKSARHAPPHRPTATPPARTLGHSMGGVNMYRTYCYTYWVADRMNVRGFAY